MFLNQTSDTPHVYARFQPYPHPQIYACSSVHNHHTTAPTLIDSDLPVAFPKRAFSLMSKRASTPFVDIQLHLESSCCNGFWHNIPRFVVVKKRNGNTSKIGSSITNNPTKK